MYYIEPRSVESLHRTQCPKPESYAIGASGSSMLKTSGGLLATLAGQSVELKSKKMGEMELSSFQEAVLVELSLLYGPRVIASALFPAPSLQIWNVLVERN